MSKKTTIPNPVVIHTSNEKGRMKFTLEKTNVSVANAIRRTILSDIKVVCLKTNNITDNLITIHTNTTRLNNEITKHRLSCIPVHIKEWNESLENLELEVNVENTTDSLKYVTTGDFKIKDKNTNKYLSDSEVLKIFPANPMTKSFIVFSRLRPKITDNIPGEKLHLTCKFSISTAGEDGAFNVASTIAYGNTPDVTSQVEAWDDREEDLIKEGINKNDIAFERENWFNHGSKRYFKDDSFDFVLETVGVYTNNELMKYACNNLVNKNNELFAKFVSESVEIESQSSIMKNSFDIKLENIDYTTGKVIEHILHEEYYKGSGTFTYVGFIKKHPHDTYSIIRIAFKDEKNANNKNINEIFKYALGVSNNMFDTIAEYFKG